MKICFVSIGINIYAYLVTPKNQLAVIIKILCKDQGSQRSKCKNEDQKILKLLKHCTAAMLAAAIGVTTLAANVSAA